LSRRFWILAAVVGGALAASALLRRPASAPRETAVPKRLVSLAPSTTEILCALGLAERLVGVCDYCEHPAEARTKERVGGYYTPNFEVLARLKPDLVLLLPEHGPVKEKIHALGVATMDVDHRDVRGILASFVEIARACGVPERGEALRADAEARLAAVREKAKGRRRPRVLISVGRAMNEGGALRVTTCGKGGFYSELLEMAGGENAYDGPVAYPALSPEGALALKPELILEIMPDLKEKGITEEAILKDWRSIPGLGSTPVKVVARDYSIIPGPRFVKLLEDFAAAVSP
jgi:iron complex transport system substrate-binding protein